MELTFTLTLILFFQETGLGNHMFPKQPIGNRASLSHSLGFVGIFVSPLIFRKPIYGFLFHCKYLGNPLSANALRFSILFPQYGTQYFESLQINSMDICPNLAIHSYIYDDLFFYNY